MRVLILFLALLALPSNAFSMTSIPSATVLHDQRADQRDEEDLQAQKEMARWAWWMLLITAGSTVVGGAGLVFLWMSLRQTRNAIRISTDTNELTERHNSLDMRPWLEIDGLSIERAIYIVIEGVEKVQMKVGYKVRNKGKLPALNLHQYARLHFGELKSVDLSQMTEEGDFRGHVSPGGEIAAQFMITLNLPPKLPASAFWTIDFGFTYKDRGGKDRYATFGQGRLFGVKTRQAAPVTVTVDWMNPSTVEVQFFHTVMN